MEEQIQILKIATSRGPAFAARRGSTWLRDESGKRKAWLSEGVAREELGLEQLEPEPTAPPIAPKPEPRLEPAAPPLLTRRRPERPACVPIEATVYDTPSGPRLFLSSGWDYAIVVPLGSGERRQISWSSWAEETAEWKPRRALTG